MSTVLELDIDSMIKITERVITEEGALGKFFRKRFDYKGFSIQVEVEVRKKTAASECESGGESNVDRIRYR